MRKGKTIILVGNFENFLDLDDETDFTVGIFSQNLATTSNFIEFQNNWNFTFFEASRVVRDTWHVMSSSQCVTCQVQGK